MQTDNSRAVRLVVSLSLNFTTRQTARELRLTAALGEINTERHEQQNLCAQVLLSVSFLVQVTHMIPVRQWISSYLNSYSYHMGHRQVSFMVQVTHRILNSQGFGFR